jgi:glucosamine--fructose-6-phosphate aminotransferase (isomerizing)
MCGIVGYVGARAAAPVIVDGLARLEYRGYDSAGIAVDNQGTLDIRRSVGKLSGLTAVLATAPVQGTMGIGHTRWATHGDVTEQNAHPHRDASGRVVVIQNGIVENYLELKNDLIAEGHTFVSQTDTEVIAHLLGVHFATTGNLAEALRRTAAMLKGGNAIVALSVDAPGTLVATRIGHAGGVVIGIGEGEMFVASDVPAIVDHTRNVCFLEDHDIAELTATSLVIRRPDDSVVDRPITRLAWDPVSIERGPYKHFMLKEIHEQPRVLTDVLRGRIDLEAGTVRLDDVLLDDAGLRGISSIVMTACGTAWHAALVGKFMIEQIARVPVQVDYASEFRYREPVLDAKMLLVAVSQSGETADTLAAMELARSAGVRTLAIVNAVGSQATRVATAGSLMLHAGPEIGVASTKAFTAMLVGQYLLALRIAQARGVLTPATMRPHLRALIALSSQVGDVLNDGTDYAALAESLQHTSSALFLGRQLSYPIALEGALKLKEISYIHAEGYPAGEMKHGPIALIDDRLPVICIAPQDASYDKMLSNVSQVKARGGRVIAITSVGDAHLAEQAEAVITVPASNPWLTTVLTSIPLQLLAYATAVRRGADVDQPRNLAKSVTVE